MDGTSTAFRLCVFVAVWHLYAPTDVTNARMPPALDPNSLGNLNKYKLARQNWEIE